MAKITRHENGDAKRTVISTGSIEEMEKRFIAIRNRVAARGISKNGFRCMVRGHEYFFTLVRG